MEGAVCGGCSVWRLQCVEGAVCGDCSVWRLQCVEGAVCGGCSGSVWRVQCVEGAVCAHKVLTRKVIGGPISVSVLQGSGAGSLLRGGCDLGQHLQR